MSRALLAFALALGLLAGPASPAPAAETRVVTWGDSITFGSYDDTAPVNCYDGFPTNNPSEACGHTGRLGSRLNDPGLFSPIYDVEMLNLGRGGEKTPGALTRMDRNTWDCPCTAAAEPCTINTLKYWVCKGTVGAEDLLLLMEGTNDISQEISLETTRTNLRGLGIKAAALGLNVVISTVVQRHPDACEDKSNAKTTDLNVEIDAVAAEKGWPLADPYGRLDPLANLFSSYYQHEDPMRCATPAPDCSDQNCDPVGHPDGHGYDKITFDGGGLYAKTFESVVRAALPPRLNVTPPAPPLAHGESLAFAAGLPDLAQTDRLVWDFGDGTVVPTEPNASPAIQEHVYDEPGVYTVIVTAEHANGGDRRRTLVVEVSVLFADRFESGDTSKWTVVVD